MPAAESEALDRGGSALLVFGVLLLVASVFGISCRVVPDPVSDAPLVVPIGRERRPSLSL